MRKAWLSGFLMIGLIGPPDPVQAQIRFSPLALPESFRTDAQRGLAFGDFDLDGDDDLAVAGSAATESVRLFENTGGTFQEVTSVAGLANSGPVKSVLWLDVNDDGFPELLTGHGELKLWKNTGQGFFEEVKSSGLFLQGNIQSIHGGDVNGDKWPDIWVGCFYCPSKLFINYGNFQFRDQTSPSGIAAENLPSMGTLLTDLDEDGDLDLYHVYDGYKPSKVYLNNGIGQFEEKAASLKLNTSSQGMGIDLADFNSDGRQDFYISNLDENFLLISENDTYVERAVSSDVANKGMGWGVVIEDFNLDGLPDIFAANQFGFSPFQNVLYRNRGNLSFINDAIGTAIETSNDSFGAASSDINSDGLPDLAIANDGQQKPDVFINTTLNRGRFLKFTLCGTQSGKEAIGTQIELIAGQHIQRKSLMAGSGYASQNSKTIIVGIPESENSWTLRIHWTSGLQQEFENLSANTHYFLEEGSSILPFDADLWKVSMTNPSLLVPSTPPEQPQQVNESWSIARIWNEELLEAIRNDFARPTHHARNLFHISAGMYDAWAAYESASQPYFLGSVRQGFAFPYDGISTPQDIPSAQSTAISYVAYRLIKHRFQQAPGAAIILNRINKLMEILGLDPSITSQDYQESPAGLGNYLAAKIIEFGLQDGANEAGGYANQFYQPVNAPLAPTTRIIKMADPNRWQPLALSVIIDQNGNVIPGNITTSLSHEWGWVTPFALRNNYRKQYLRNGVTYNVFHDPGPPPKLNLKKKDSSSELYQWNFSLVAIWSAQLTSHDQVVWDISPASTGNLSSLPETLDEFKAFYPWDGRAQGSGYSLNPITNQAYQPQLVKRGDFARTLAEFWADGPKSETPPGHWFTIFNKVSDHPALVKKIEGTGDEVNSLEWDIKGYFMLGGGLHDAAVTAWSIKGYYDYVRPISAIRYMSSLGQSSESGKPDYHPAGIPLVPGYIERVVPGDSLALVDPLNIGKIKIKAWRGPDFISDPQTQEAGVGWILGEYWWPYQRPTFVTPPFAGYISGHSTFSRTAATILASYTGSEYFPGGYSDFLAPQNSYLVFEEGPSSDVRLQWAKYSDAADQCSLSRIWGGIHPPADDIPGRKIGVTVGLDAYNYAKSFFTPLVTRAETETESIDFIYPNPVKSNSDLYINKKYNQHNYTLTNATGQTVSEGIVMESKIFINAVPGVYLLTLKSRADLIIHRVIIL